MSNFGQALEEKFHISQDTVKNACSLLPTNYDFEISKTILRILEAKEQRGNAESEMNSENENIPQYKVAL